MHLLLMAFVDRTSSSLEVCPLSSYLLRRFDADTICSLSLSHCQYSRIHQRIQGYKSRFLAYNPLFAIKPNNCPSVRSSTHPFGITQSYSGRLFSCLPARHPEYPERTPSVNKEEAEGVSKGAVYFQNFQNYSRQLVTGFTTQKGELERLQFLFPHSNFNQNCDRTIIVDFHQHMGAKSPPGRW